MALEAVIRVQPIDPKKAAELTGLSGEALERHFRRSEGTLSPQFEDGDLDKLATYVDYFHQKGITPDQLEVTVGEFGRRLPGGRREVNNIRVIEPEHWREQVAERHRRVAAEPADHAVSGELPRAGEGQMLVESSPERPESGEKPQQKVAKHAKKVKAYLDADQKHHIQHPDVDKEKGKQLGFVIKGVIAMVIEMIPGGLGPWGVGDIATAIEAVAGRTIDGLKLSMKERLIYLGASAIPVIPARPILEGYRWFVRHNREANQPQQLPPPQQ